MANSNSARRINELCDRFEAAWKSGAVPRIEDYLDPDISDPRRLLIELVMLDLEYRWRSTGDLPTSDATAESFPSRPRLADYITRYSLLGPAKQLPDELLAEEYRARRRWGNVPGSEEYLREFGAQRPDLSGLLRQVDVDLAAGHETEPGENAAAGPESRDANVLPNGTKIRYFGDYEILEKLGEGGMGVVYKARQVSLQRLVALKMIKRGQLASQEEVERFHNEAQAAAKLDHRGIVPVFEVGEHQGQHYFSMGYVEGQSLSQEVAQGPLSQRRAAELVEKVAEAVAYAHGQGVIHRDLKPANILIGKDGNPRVTDFGLAKRLDSDSGLTVIGGYMGTPSYMPPEQASGRMDQVDERSDVYSLGATLYHLLTGHPPFQGATALETRMLVRTAEPVAPRQLNPVVHRDLETVCLKCLDKEQPRRYCSADELCLELGRFLSGMPIRARALGRFARGWRWCKRQPVIASLVAAAIVLLLAGTTVSTYFAVRATIEKRRSESNLYFSLITIARHKLLAGDTRQATHLLGQCSPTLRHWEWSYVQGLCQREQRRISCTDLVPGSMTFSSDFARLACVCSNGTIRIWDVVSGRQIQLLHCGGIPQDTPRFSADGRHLACSKLPGKETRVWNVDTGKQTLAFADPHVYILSPDGKYIALSGGHQAAPEVAVYDVRSGKPRLNIGGHAFSFSPDGKHLVSCSLASEISIWDITTGSRRLIPVKRAGLLMPPYSPDGRYLALEEQSPNRDEPSPVPSSDKERHSVSDRKGGPSQGEKRIAIWDTHHSSVACAWTTPARWFRDTAFSADGSRFATIDNEGEITVRETTTKREPLVLRAQHPMWHVTFSSDGKRLLATGFGSGAYAWNLPAGELIRIPCENGVVMGVSSDGSQVAIGNTVWDTSSGRALCRLPIHSEAIFSLAMSPNNRHIAYADESSVTIWDCEASSESYGVGGDSRPIRGAAFSPDGRFLAVLSDKRFSVWNIVDKCIWFYHEFSERSSLPDPGQVYVGELPKELRLVVPKGTETMVWQPCQNVLYAYKGWGVNISFSRDGKLVAAAPPKPIKLRPGQRGGQLTWSGGNESSEPEHDMAATNLIPTAAVVVWDVATGEEVCRLNRQGEYLNNIVFSPVKNQIAIASDTAVGLWDARTGRERLPLLGAHGRVAFTPDGKRIVTFGDKTSVECWSPLTGEKVVEFHRTGMAAVSPDSRRLLVFGETGHAELLALRDGKTLFPFGESLRLAAFSADGARFVTLGSDPSPRLWDANELRALVSLRGQSGIASVLLFDTCMASGALSSAAFSCDGKRIITIGNDKTLRLWDAATGREILDLPFGSFPGIVFAPTFSPDGRTVAAIADDYSVRLWLSERPSFLGGTGMARRRK